MKKTMKRLSALLIGMMIALSSAMAFMQMRLYVQL